MKIVTYNINGLRPRVSQFGSLLKLLDSLHADIICFQETKLSRHDLTADVLIADGYECFFSCTRTSEKGRVSYSGVATFCRVKSAFSSNEVPLPIAAEEGFTGVLESLKGSTNGGEVKRERAAGLEEFTKDELLKVDSEGRCVMTDHGHFVLFNIYGPRAVSDDTERVEFKQTFFKILQKRCEFLLSQGRRVCVVGDLNIAPAAVDSCNPKPDFDKNEFRRLFRSLLVENGGSFYDVFRSKHPERREAYTHWSQSTGAEEFNYGSRIDHILIAGSCVHEYEGQQGHDVFHCHVNECDIMAEFKRWRPGNSPRWKGGRNIKLEGSDHVPVYMSLVNFPDVLQHSTPSLSARYAPEIRGVQQTIVSLLMKRQISEQMKTFEVQSLSSEENLISVSRNDSVNRSSPDCVTPGSSVLVREEIRKKAKKSQLSQLSLKSFFQKISGSGDGHDNPESIPMADQENFTQAISSSIETSVEERHDHIVYKTDDCASSQEHVNPDPCCSSETQTSKIASQEWQRIKQLMQKSIPLCKGHHEPCVSRVVKKAGPTFGRSFYVCARAEGPASNPEANCGFFKWAASKPRGQK